jgi:hypothetical protein
MTTLGRSRTRVYPVLGAFILGIIAVLVLKIDETAWALLWIPYSVWVIGRFLYVTRQRVGIRPADAFLRSRASVGQVIEVVLVLMLLVLTVNLPDVEGSDALPVLVGLVGFAIGLIDRREGTAVSAAGETKIPWLQQLVPWK